MFSGERSGALERKSTTAKAAKAKVATWQRKWKRKAKRRFWKVGRGTLLMDEARVLKRRAGIAEETMRFKKERQQVHVAEFHLPTRNC